MARVIQRSLIGTTVFDGVKFNPIWIFLMTDGTMWQLSNTGAWIQAPAIPAARVVTEINAISLPNGYIAYAACNDGTIWSANSTVTPFAWTQVATTPP